MQMQRAAQPIVTTRGNLRHLFVEAIDAPADRGSLLIPFPRTSLEHSGRLALQTGHPGNTTPISLSCTSCAPLHRAQPSPIGEPYHTISIAHIVERDKGGY